MWLETWEHIIVQLVRLVIPQVDSQLLKLALVVQLVLILVSGEVLTVSYVILDIIAQTNQILVRNVPEALTMLKEGKVLIIVLAVEQAIMDPLQG